MADVKKTMMRAGIAASVGLYRASKGRIMSKAGGLPVLLLTVAGRKTGVEHTSPLGYLEDGGRYVVTGSGAGSAAEPQWFRNLRSTDHAVIEVGPERINVSVKIADPEERGILWDQLVTRAPGYGKYQTKTTREIPMAALTPTN